MRRFDAGLHGIQFFVDSCGDRVRVTRSHPPLAVITAAAKHHMSTVSDTRGLKPHLCWFTTHRQPAYRGRLCAADSEDESTAV
jgi:hypothetical protein